MSPAQIKILLHYHVSPDEYNSQSGNKFIKGEINKFIDCGLMAETTDGYERDYTLTEKGHFYVTDGLCAVPLPVQIFKIPVENDL